MSPVPVTTKPQAKASRAKPAGRADAVYVHGPEPDLHARLGTLQAALVQAAEHIGSACDAADDGSDIEVMLKHIGQVLLADAMRPMMSERPTRDDADRTYGDLFLVKATLNAARGMAVNASIRPVLKEAFELLDWSQIECGSPALLNLLPDGDPATDFARGRDHAIKMLGEAEKLQDEREGLRRYRRGGAQDNLVRGYLDEVLEDRTLIAGFTSVLSAAVRNDNMDLSELAQVTLAETRSGVPGLDGTIAAADVADSTQATPAAPVSPQKSVLAPELVVNEAVGLNNLISWIMSARDTLEQLKDRARADPVLDEALSKNDVMYCEPEWFGQGANEGIAYLLMYQRDVIDSLGGGAS